MVPTSVRQDFRKCASGYLVKRGRADNHHVEIIAESGVRITRAAFVKAVSNYPSIRGMVDANKMVVELRKQKYINVVYHDDGLGERDPLKLLHSKFHAPRRVWQCVLR